jgi:hypothetical protein
MLRYTTVTRLRQPDAIDDPLTELAREGARRMLATVLIAEADAFVALWKDVKLSNGRDRVVRHGHGPERAIQTGVGPVAVRRAKVRDRGKVGAAEKIRFASLILPKWARRTKRRSAPGYQEKWRHRWIGRCSGRRNAGSTALGACGYLGTPPSAIVYAVTGVHPRNCRMKCNGAGQMDGAEGSLGKGQDARTKGGRLTGSRSRPAGGPRHEELFMPAAWRQTISNP